MFDLFAAIMDVAWIAGIAYFMWNHENRMRQVEGRPILTLEF